MTAETARQFLESLNLGEVRAYSTHDFGRERDSRCASVVLGAQEAREALVRVLDQVPQGLVAFVGTSNWYGDEAHDGVELVVAPGDTQFDILRIARSDAVNYSLETEDLVRKLKEYDHAVGIQILSAETDTIQFVLKAAPTDWTAFAEDIYRFCPDIVDQGCDTVEAFEQEIRSSGVVYLWWD